MLKVYKTFYSFLLYYKWKFFLFAFCLIIFSVAGSVQPYFYKLFIDAIPRNNFNELYWILLLFVGLRILQVAFDMLTFYIGDKVLFAAGRDARIAVFKKIQDLDFAFHSSKSTGSLISAIKRGDGAFYSIHDNLNIELVRIIINFFVVIGFLLTVQLEITIIMTISFLINIVIARYLIMYNMKKREAFNEAEDEISGVITDNLINFETVKYFAKENWERERLQEKYKNWSKVLWSFANTFRLIDISVGTIGNTGMFIVLLYALQLMSRNNLTPGQFILILGFVTDFYPKFYQLVFRFRDVTKNYADLKTYFAILDNEVLIKDPLQPVKKTDIKGDIQFNDITFIYPEGKEPSLDNFSLDIKSGESIAFVGKSGAGKTTTIKLLLRLFDVQQGKITIDGINIKNFTKSQLRSFMGVVPQDPILFNNTIRYNIAYGSSNPTDQEVQVAAKVAHLDEFIYNLPQGYETNVGERGIKLSGGQKQRLAIARMLLANPKIIIFDEATSQLDSESEKIIQEAFWKVAKNKTTLIIAHRLATVVHADKIVVMEKGEVKEVGSHSTLLNTKDSLYRHFWQLQSQGNSDLLE